MDEEYQVIGQTGSIALKEAIDLQSILNGQMFEVNSENVFEEEPNTLPIDLNIDEVSKLCLGDDADDEDTNMSPFESLALKMFNVTDDGYVKKRIINEGVGGTPQDSSIAFVLYTSYLEYCDEPIDFAFAKKPLKLRLGSVGIFGLTVAVKSMKSGEKSQFLIGPQYAFGSMGHPPRIPPDATFLFQIELVRFVNSDAELEMDKLTLEDRRDFLSVCKTAEVLIGSGREHFKNNLKMCIRDYNKAVSILEECSLSNMYEQEKQQKLLFKLYGNLAVCYNKDNNPRRACIMCNNIYALSRNTSVRIPAKIYFNNGRALLLLNEFQRARDKLVQAQRLDPNNAQITNELRKCTEKINEESLREKNIAKQLLNNDQTDTEFHEEDTSQDAFKTEIGLLCEDLLKNNEQTQIKLPAGLTATERDAAKSEAEKFGLKFRESKHNENEGNLVFYISKIM